MLNALHFSHQCLSELIYKFPSGNFIDATIGNGHDIHAILTHPEFRGKVFGFDIQKQALNNTREKLHTLNNNRYELYLEGHQNISNRLQEIDTFAGTIFNLGYLPGGNHAVTTSFENTQLALCAIQKKLLSGGQIIIVAYSGHLEGKEEKDQLLAYLESWPQEYFKILHYQFINQVNYPPSCIIIERLKS